MRYAYKHRALAGLAKMAANWLQNWLIPNNELLDPVHRNNRHRMRAPISCQSKNGRHKMAKLARPRTFCAKANGNF